MADQKTMLSAVGLTPSRWTEVRPLLATALVNLDLADSFAAVEVSADDLPGQGDAWYRLEIPAVAAALATLGITCHPEVFCSHQSARTSAQPSRPIWESVASRAEEETSDLAAFSTARTEAFFHHHLLTVQDLMTGMVLAEMVPRNLIEAFAAVWSVVVDGRLQRRHLPSYDLAERRGSFSRLFGTAGILLPGHWQIFQAFWDGSITEQKRVLEAVRQLPRL